MLKGHIFSNQIYVNNIAALVNKTFSNSKNGIFKNFKNNMEVTYSGHEVTINSGACIIQGRPLEEDSSSTIDAGIETAFCKLVIEIDLSKENTEEDFEQGLYNVVKSSSGYPNLTQEDTIANNGKYQFELARFKISGGAISNFEDKRIYINEELNEQNILWQDDNGSYMNENQTANLTERVSNQKNGIVLIFSSYTPGQGSHDYGWYEYFIPKKIIELKPGGGHDILIPDNSRPYGVRSAKYLYVFDDHINGNAFNVGEHNNLNNSLAVLRYVIGV